MSMDWVKEMREHAQWLSWADQLAGSIGGVTVDDIREYALTAGKKPKHPNCFGAIFKGKGWKLIGYRKSQWPTNHGRRIGVWAWSSETTH